MIVQVGGGGGIGIRNRRLARPDQCRLSAPGVSRIEKRCFMKVGFIGSGHMGAGMAASLLAVFELDEKKP